MTAGDRHEPGADGATASARTEPAEAGNGPGDALPRRLRTALDEVLAATLSTPPGVSRACALLDFPPHRNVGDSLIWLGEIDSLARHGLDVRYACDLACFDAERLEERVPEGPILLHGGGNLGDVWPQHQAFRERVLERFPDRLVIQLPQSIWFEKNDALDRARRAFAGHDRFTLLVRDHESLEIARRDLGIEARLCPDMVFGIERVPERPTPDVEVVWLARTDHEASVGMREPPPGVLRVDWAHKERDPATRLRKKLTRWVADGRSLAGPAQRMLQATYRGAAERRLRFGSALLGRGRAVVTDRLHAHLLSLMLGIPHVILDNSYGKVSAFHRAWTAKSPLCRAADDLDQAFETARHLAETA